MERGYQSMSWLRTRAEIAVDLVPAEETGEALVQGLPRGSQEMLGPWHHWPAASTVAWLKQQGVRLSPAEKGSKPWQASSRDVVTALEGRLAELGVVVETGRHALEMGTRPDGYQVWFEEGEPLVVEALVLATGTAQKKGLAMAEALGHAVTPLCPSLMTVKLRDARIRNLQGQPPVEAEVRFADKPGLPAERVERGDLEILGNGLGGPAIANLTAWAAPTLAGAKHKFPLVVNWVPDWGGQIARELSQRAVHHAKAAVMDEPQAGLPPKLWARLVEASKMTRQDTWGGVSKRQLSTLVGNLTQGRFQASGHGMHKPEFAYAGGVARDEIDFRTMESRRCPRLYFAGEMVDCDGVLGGYNALLALTHAQLIAAGVATT
ncbi:MAG: putative FAD dependent oxidoreductase [Puniceicoccaceae bacterium 5H]|nr:MAG: putative FAD dependent oxidoreductase [Puniceicoccaceae bacterium 5H]